MSSPAAPQAYSKQIYSGRCVCTHSAQRHHGSVVGNADYFAQTGESRIAGACLHYGSNESADSHCSAYWDAANPLPDPDVNRRPTPPSLEVRSRTRQYRINHLDPAASSLRTPEEWLTASQKLTADSDTIPLDAERILRLEIGVTDRDDPSPSAPYFYAIALHLDRCLTSSDSSRYDIWWLENQVVDTTLPFPDNESAPTPDQLRTILAKLAASLHRESALHLETDPLIL